MTAHSSPPIRSAAPGSNFRATFPVSKVNFKKTTNCLHYYYVLLNRYDSVPESDMLTMAMAAYPEKKKTMQIDKRQIMDMLKSPEFSQAARPGEPEPGNRLPPQQADTDSQPTASAVAREVWYQPARSDQTSPAATDLTASRLTVVQLRRIKPWGEYYIQCRSTCIIWVKRFAVFQRRH